MNLSYTSYDPDADEASAIQTAWVSYGVPTINSAGNDNRDTSVYSPYPCSDLYVMCVGDADNQGNRWTTTDLSKCQFPTGGLCGSNYGSVVDYAAPAVTIWTTASTGDFSYEAESGTSLASPEVAGIAALLRSIGCSPDHQHEAISGTANATMSPWTFWGFVNGGGALHYWPVPCP